MSPPPPLPDDLLQFLAHYDLGRYMDVSASVIYFYDYLLTLELEISYVWKSRWSFPKVLYLLSRYLPFVEIILNYFRDSAPGVTRYCNTLYHIIICAACTLGLYMFGMLVSEVLLTIRVWAVWNMNKYLIFINLLVSFANFAFIGSITELTIKDMEYLSLKSFTGCLHVAHNPRIHLALILVTVYDAVMLIFMVIPFVITYRRPGENMLFRRSRFVSVIIAEGILFYIYLFGVSIATTSILSQFKDNPFVFVYISRVMRSALACRMVLHLRKFYHSRDWTEYTSRVLTEF